MEILDILKKLCLCFSVSGDENRFLDCVNDICSNLKTETDNIGNVIITKKAENEKRRVLLDAHYDQIGFIVTGFYDNGFVKLDSVGSVDERTLIGARVCHTHSGIVGVFSSVPPHLQKGDGKNYPELSSLAVDFGFELTDIKEKIQIGDYICLKGDCFILNKDYFCAPALDNKAGCAIMLSLINSINLKNTSLTLLLSTQEELGLRGARAHNSTNFYDEVICIDASFAYADGCPRVSTGNLNGGAMLGVGPILSKRLKKCFEDTSKKHNIPMQYEILSSTTGTNADALTLKAQTAECALISFPIRNMHSAIEMLSLKDLDNTAKLISEYIKEADLNA